MPPQLSKEEMEGIWHFTREGKVYWKEGRKQVNAGDEVGCYAKSGYRVLTYKGYQYKVHRLIFAYYQGRWPYLVDHINGDPSDNSIDNLREVTPHENSINTRKVSGKIPYRGVSDSPYGFRAFFQSKGVREFLGYFKTAEEASRVYETRREQLHPNFVGGYHTL